MSTELTGYVRITLTVTQRVEQLSDGNFPLVLQQLTFLRDTRSRRHLLVFAQANPSRLPLAMGISQPGIPVRRMAADRKTKVTDALVRILRRFLTPVTIPMDGMHDQFFREVLLETARLRPATKLPPKQQRRRNSRQNQETKNANEFKKTNLPKPKKRKGRRAPRVFLSWVNCDLVRQTVS